MDQSPALTTTAVRQLLNLWDQVPELGRHPLATLDCVQHKVRQSGHLDSAVGSGLALKGLLHEAVQTLRPFEGEPDYVARAWRPYLIIHQRYVLGRIPEWIMLELSISERTFYRELREGLERVLAQFEHWELEARQLADAARPQAAPVPVLRPPSFPTHTIVGREGLVAAAVNRLLDPRGRAIALQGIPGVGKTTAALLLTRDPAVRERFGDRVLWIGVGPDPDILSLLTQIALRVGLSEAEIGKLTTAEPLTAAISHRLEGRSWFFILDDVWRAGDGRRLMLGGDETAICLTTRQIDVAVELSGGQTMSVMELDPADGRTLLEPLADQLSTDEINRLLQLTGGLPLALQIVSRYLQREGFGGQTTRLKAALEQLQALETRIALPPRTNQPSLAAVIGLSLEALSAAERACLIELTLFPPKPNRFSATAAAEIADADPQMLYQLVDAGLLEPAGDDRYALHQTIFDAVRVGDGLPQGQNRLTCYYVNYLETFRPDRYHAIEIEDANIRQALKLSTEAAERYARLLFPYGRYLVDRGRLEETERLLAQPPLDRTPSAEARIRVTQGRVAQAENRAADALAHYLQGSALAEEADLPHVALRAKILAMKMHLRRGDHAAAQALGAETHRQIEEVDDLHWRASAHLALSAVSYYLSDLPAALFHVQNARKLYEQLPDKAPLAGVYQNLGAFSVALGEYGNAFVYYDFALEQCRQAGHRYREAQIEMNLGVVSVDVGQWRKAHRHYANALAIQTETGNLDVLEQTYLNLSVLAIAEHDTAAAEAALERGFELSFQTEYLYRRTKFWVARSMLHLRQARSAEGVTAAETAVALADSLDSGLLIAEADLQLGTARLYAGKPKSAIESLTRAAARFEQHPLPPMLAEADAYLAWAHAQLGDLKAAARHVKRASTYLFQRVDGIHDAAEVLILCQSLFGRIGQLEAAERLQRRIETYLDQQAQQIESDEARARYRAWHADWVTRLSR